MTPAQPGDDFRQERRQFDCEAEVLEAVLVPVFFQRLKAGQKRAPQFGQERAGEFGEVELRVDSSRSLRG